MNRACRYCCRKTPSYAFALHACIGTLVYYTHGAGAWPADGVVCAGGGGDGGKGLTSVNLYFLISATGYFCQMRSTVSYWRHLPWCLVCGIHTQNSRVPQPANFTEYWSTTLVHILGPPGYVHNISIVPCLAWYDGDKRPESHILLVHVSRICLRLHRGHENYFPGFSFDFRSIPISYFFSTKKTCFFLLTSAINRTA